MYKLNTKANKPQWFKYDKNESVELLISPLSIYNFKRLPSQQGFELTIEEYAYLLDKLLVDWKGVYDTDEKEITCTSEIKRLIADVDQDMASFILKKATELKEKISIKEESVKNL